MNASFPLLLVLPAFGFALWLGAYLLSRDASNPRLRWTGMGLVVYAAALACQSLSVQAEPGELELFAGVCNLLLIVPALLWTGAVIHLLPEEEPWRPRLARAWLFGQIPLALALFAAGGFSATTLESGIERPVSLAFVLTVLLPLVVALVLVTRLVIASQPKQPLGLLLAALMLFTLSTAFLILPLAWLPRPWLILALGIDLALLGLSIAILDAFDQGHTLLPELLRSLGEAGLAAALFGSLVALAIFLETGLTVTMQALLLGVIAAAILLQTWSRPFQALLDALAFPASPGMKQERAALRASLEAVPKVYPDLKLASLDSEALNRLTRKALSHYGNLPRLAASPLTRLPIIQARLAARQTPANTLARAAELKALLAEGIRQLKPAGEEAFGETEEWRFYNALYFPYVAGLRPYTRRAVPGDLTPAEIQALRWFQSQVPERTLYNWQKAAAGLVARYLREISPKVSKID